MEYCDLNMDDEMQQGHITVHVLCYLKIIVLIATLDKGSVLGNQKVSWICEWFISLKIGRPMFLVIFAATALLLLQFRVPVPSKVIQLTLSNDARC